MASTSLTFQRRLSSVQALGFFSTFVRMLQLYPPALIRRSFAFRRRLNIAASALLGPTGQDLGFGDEAALLYRLDSDVSTLDAS